MNIIVYYYIMSLYCKETMFFCCLWNSESWLDWLFRIEVC